MLTHFIAAGVFADGVVVITPPEPAGALAAFRMRYPEFDEVPDARVNYWLSDAERYVKVETYGVDYEIALLLATAHQLALSGFGGGGGDLPAGVTQMRSGALSLSFDAGTVKAQAEGGWAATRYGAQFLALLRLTHGGPRVTRGVVVSGIGCQSGYRQSLLGGFYG